MCKDPLKRKVASQFLNVLAQFLMHYQHLKKKKVMRHPKVRREGTRNNFVFLCDLMDIFFFLAAHVKAASTINKIVIFSLADFIGTHCSLSVSSFWCNDPWSNLSIAMFQCFSYAIKSYDLEEIGFKWKHFVL